MMKKQTKNELVATPEWLKQYQRRGWSRGSRGESLCLRVRGNSVKPGPHYSTKGVANKAKITRLDVQIMKLAKKICEKDF